MENANPPLTPELRASLKHRVENEIRELNELSDLIDAQLEYARNTHMNTTGDNPMSLGSVEEKGGERTGDEYFNLYPTKEEIAYYHNIIDNPHSPFTKIDPKVKRGDPRNVKIPCMIGYKYINQAYINFESPINVMSSSVYNNIVNRKLTSRKDPNYPGGVCNFVGRVRDLHVLVGNFTYVTDFMIVEDW